MAQPPIDRPLNLLSPINASPSGIPGIPISMPPATTVAWYPTANGQRQTWDVASAKNAFQTLDNSIVSKIYKGFDAAYGKGKWTYSDVINLWSDSVDGAGVLFSQYGQTKNYNITPDIVLLERLSTLSAAGLDANGKPISDSGDGGGVSSSTTKSFNLTDASTARGLIDQALGNYLGRAATLKEQETFLKALNVQEQNNPSVTNQTAVSGKGSTSVTSKTTGGFNPSVFAAEYAAGQEGAGEFRAATSLLDTFIGALGAKI